MIFFRAARLWVARFKLRLVLNEIAHTLRAQAVALRCDDIDEHRVLGDYLDSLRRERFRLTHRLQFLNQP